jgi:hypothetical protein
MSERKREFIGREKDCLMLGFVSHVQTEQPRNFDFSMKLVTNIK